MRQVVEKATEYKTPVFLCFVDLTKAYDSVNRQATAAILREYGVPHQLVKIIEELHSEPGGKLGQQVTLRRDLK